MKRNRSGDNFANQNLSASERGGKYLSFFLEEEEYGIEILKVQEIIGMLPVTPIPRTPAFVRGVINLRGKVIPVTDLRRTFSMGTIDQTSETCIIVVRTNGLEIGVMVDKVSEVLDIAHSEVEGSPCFGTNIPIDFLIGIGRVNDRVRLLLDIDRLLGVEDVPHLSQTCVVKEQARAL